MPTTGYLREKKEDIMLYSIFMIVQEREFRNHTQQACLLRIISEKQNRY